MATKNVEIVGCVLIVVAILIGGVFITLWALGVFSDEDALLPTEPTTPSNPNTTGPIVRKYRPQVVEYAKIHKPSKPQQEADENLYQYGLMIGLAWLYYKSDIVVFPENGLNNFGTAQLVPEPEDQVVPCKDPSYDNILQTLSCDTKRYEVYAVVNMIEKSQCPDRQQIRLNDTRPCPPSGINYYNTNVVFNRQGQVVAKYRKFNLFNEPGITKPFKSELSTFETDFGITFGLFTCFDILFQSPAYDLVKAGITDFITTSQWFSELPFLTAVQTQAAWAHVHNVNLIAAGLSYPTIGSTGSGIYHGRCGPMKSVMQGVFNQTVHFSHPLPHIDTPEEIYFPDPIRKSPEVMLGLTMLKDQVENFVGQHITGPSRVFTLCMNDFCCAFSVQGDFNRAEEPGVNFYEYWAFVYNGLRSFSGAAEARVKICGIAACTSADKNTCGDRFPAGVNVQDRIRFDGIYIEAYFAEKIDGEALVLPSTVDTSINPLLPSEFEYGVENGSSRNKHYLLLTKSKQDLLGFGLYGIFY